MYAVPRGKALGRNPHRDAWRASPLSIITLDERGVIRSCNPATERLLARSETDLLGVALTSLVHPVDRGALRQMMTEALGGRVPGRQEIRFRRPTGDPVVTGFSVAPTDDGHGAVCVVRDLSAEKAFRPQLLHTERMASIGAVASVVAHELNNALAGALGCIQLIPRDGEPSTSELLESVEDELRRSAEIVRDLKNYARAEAGMTEHIDLAQVLGRMQRLRRFARKDHDPPTLHVEFDDGLPPMVGNANQMLQALLNLVHNAEQAVEGLPAVRRVIRVRATVTHQMVVLEVADRGPGITPEHKSRLFEPFYSTKPAGDGTGLGLTVVQAIAAGHGGRVEVDDTPGGGATFRLLLPQASAPRPANAAPRRRHRDTARPRLDGARILLADDEPVICRVVERACSHHNAIITRVHDADAAIDALRVGEFDLVLLDVRMPGGGGPAVFRTIHADYPELVGRTLFMSGELSADMGQIVGHGYAGILHKPFELHDLLDTLEDTLTRAWPRRAASGGASS